MEEIIFYDGPQPDHDPMGPEKLAELKDFLSKLPSESVEDSDELCRLADLLASCWDRFDGSDDEGMRADKLSGRMENVTWQRPLLSFEIERHGATVLGSTRAEIQGWELNLEKLTASCGRVGVRQVDPMSPRLNVVPLVEEVVALIRDRVEDPRLTWSRDGTVRVRVGETLQDSLDFVRTRAGRRRRFREALVQALHSDGWAETRQYRFARIV